jgi:hypothetical protein
MGVSGRIAKFFQDSQLTPLAGMLALLLGLFAVAITPREEEPQINVTMANVFVPFPGASARDVEALVAGPAEQVLAQMSGVEHVYSVSRPGMAVLTVQFEVGVPRLDALVRLHDTIQTNRDWVSPQLGTLEPIIKPKGIDDVPVVTLTLWSTDPQRGAYELERVAHAAEIELKRVPGTREVQTLGGRGAARTARPGPAAATASGARREERPAARQRSAARGQAGARQPRDRHRDREFPQFGGRRARARGRHLRGASGVRLGRRRCNGRARPAVALRLDRRRRRGASRRHAAGHQEAGRKRGGGRARDRKTRRGASRHHHSGRRARHGDARLRRHG